MVLDVQYIYFKKVFPITNKQSDQNNIIRVQLKANLLAVSWVSADAHSIASCCASMHFDNIIKHSFS